jgi:5'-methylthioadenosine phosphorylase
VGRLEGTKIAFLPRHGKGHRIQPSSLNFRANIYAMKMLGVHWIIGVSAVGSMKENIHPGDMVIPNQFIDRTVGRPNTFFSDGVVCHISFADPVCPTLSQILGTAGQEVGATVHKEEPISVSKDLNFQQGPNQNFTVPGGSISSE